MILMKMVVIFQILVVVHRMILLLSFKLDKLMNLRVKKLKLFKQVEKNLLNNSNHILKMRFRNQMMILLNSVKCII